MKIKELSRLETQVKYTRPMERLEMLKKATLLNKENETNDGKIWLVNYNSHTESPLFYNYNDMNMNLKYLSYAQYDVKTGDKLTEDFKFEIEE